MPSVVSCPHCQARLRVEERHAGKVIACPRCKKQISVPADETPAAASQPTDKLATSPPSPAAAPDSVSEDYELVDDDEPTGPRPQRGRGDKRDRNKDVKQERQCPYCSETILATARKCKHCGEIIDPKLRKSRKEIPDKQTAFSPDRVVMALAIVTLLVFIYFGLRELGLIH